MSESGTRQIGVVVDLNKCMGCQTCVVACKQLRTNKPGMERTWWMKVNTYPGRGYPRDWEQMGGGYDADDNLVLGDAPVDDDYGSPLDLRYNDLHFGGHGTDVHLVPREQPTWGPNWDGDIGGGEYPNSFFFYLPRQCNHCWRPSCVEGCPRNAISKNEDGIVIIDQDVCTGCEDPVCVRACPYKEITYDPVDAVASKCDLCVDRLADGVAPACIRQCPGRALRIGYLNEEGDGVHQLVREWKVALPLHGEYRTGPNMYYVPPLAAPAFDEDGNIDESTPRIPLEQLRGLFGPRVDEALETLAREREQERDGGSGLMDLLVAPRWKTLLGEFAKDPSEVPGVRRDKSSDS